MRDLKINNGGLVHCNGSFIATLPTGNEFKIAFGALLAEVDDNKYCLEHLDVHTIAPVHNPLLSSDKSRTIIIGLLGEEEGNAWIQQQSDKAEKAVLEWGNNTYCKASTNNTKDNSQDDIKTYLSDFVECIKDNLDNTSDFDAEDLVELSLENYNRTIDVRFDDSKLISIVKDIVDDAYDNFVEEELEVSK